MRVPSQYDDIRRYYDEEVNPALAEILAQTQISKILATILGGDNAEYFLRTLAPINSIDDFQREVISVLMTAIEHKTCTDVKLYGTEYIDRSKGHLFISNHRDIVLDSGFLNVHLFYKGFKTTQIAIGNNLLVYPWIEHAVRINKSFVVRRNGSIKEQLLISKKLSEYIRIVLSEQKESVWLAQREGRAKDSNDITQSSLIKMLNMSGRKSFVENMRELNITPVSINYEYDPCDFLKAKEFQQKRDDANYKKSPGDDIKSMQTGLMGRKGRVSLVISEPLNINETWNELPRNEQAEALSKALDTCIHRNYLLFENNYIAADLLSGGTDFSGHYSASQVATFVRYIENQLLKIDLPNRDEMFLRRKMYEMYANPAINQSKLL